MKEADVDLDRTVVLPLFIPILGLDLAGISKSAYELASKPVRLHSYVYSDHPERI